MSQLGTLDHSAMSAPDRHRGMKKAIVALARRLAWS
jgi:hypothetical protein